MSFSGFSEKTIKKVLPNTSIKEVFYYHNYDAHPLYHISQYITSHNTLPMQWIFNVENERKCKFSMGT